MAAHLAIGVILRRRSGPPVQTYEEELIPAPPAGASSHEVFAPSYIRWAMGSMKR